MIALRISKTFRGVPAEVLSTVTTLGLSDRELTMPSGRKARQGLAAGWDEAFRTCYSKYLDDRDDFPRSLREAKAGDRLRLVIRVRQSPATTLRTRATVQRARPGEVPGEAGRREWRELLGCR